MSSLKIKAAIDLWRATWLQRIVGQVGNESHVVSRRRGRRRATLMTSSAINTASGARSLNRDLDVIRFGGRSRGCRESDPA